MGFFSKEEYDKKTLFDTIDVEIQQRRNANSQIECKGCKLHSSGCKSPRMEPHGGFKKKTLVWFEAPGSQEDEENEQLVGKSGQYLESILDDYNISLHDDCLKLNSCDCRPPKNRKPTATEIKACYPRKEKALRKYKPKVILLGGDSAVSSFYSCDPERSWIDLSISSLRGKAIPDRKTNAWVCHTFHPSFIIRGNEELKEPVFRLDLSVFSSLVKKQKRPRFDSYKDVQGCIDILSDYEEIVELLKSIKKDRIPFVFDYETTSFRYHEKIHDLYLVSIGPILKENKNPNTRIDMDRVYVFPYKKTDNGDFFLDYRERVLIRSVWKEILSDEKIGKVAQNIKHEEKASIVLCKSHVNGFIWDTMIGNRVTDESRGVNGLKFMAQHYFGAGNYSASTKEFMECDIGEKNKFDLLPMKTASLYCGMDTYYTRKLYYRQQKQVKARRLLKAYKLLHNGSLSFADMELTGIRLDLDLLDSMKKKWQKELSATFNALAHSEEAKTFERKRGRPIQFKKEISREDMKFVVFKILKLKPRGLTRTGQYSIDEKNLSYYSDDSGFVRNELKRRKLFKRLTFLYQFERFNVDGFLYPEFLLDTARTFRSSSKNPNFQQIIKRDEEGAVIRKIIIPRDGNVICEVDYGSMEVRILACWSHDKTLIKFIHDDYDFHGYWAERMFLKKQHEYEEKKEWKNYRFLAKNNFVFALFYGSYYKSIAERSWEFVPDWFYSKLRNDDRYGKWENHIKKCENDFWKMFQGVREKQFEAVDEFKRLGYLKMMGWGFERHGYLSRNEIFNTHIQGPAFHCLLWSINQIRRHVLPKHKRTLLPGQIHDAGFFDMYKGDIENVTQQVTYIMTKKLVKNNGWLNVVPFSTEWKKGHNWYEMKDFSPNV